MGYENYYSLEVNGMNINDKLAQYGLDVFQTGQYLYTVIM